jgi:hypothetical protein
MICIVAILLASALFSIHAQDTNTTFDPEKTFLIVTTDGAEFAGSILSEDEYEILVATETLGKVAITKMKIESITDVEPGFLTSKGQLIPEGAFASRYSFTTNALPIDAGNHYSLWNIWGFEFQFALAKNFGIGLMTTWAGVPLVMTLKYSIHATEMLNFGAGALVGSGTWGDWDAAGVLPFGVLTIGNRQYNINASAGYGYFWNGDSGGLSSSAFEPGGRALISIAGMAKLVGNVTLIFDTLIVPEEKLAIIFLPFFRWDRSSRKSTSSNSDRAWQIGFVGVIHQGEPLIAFPVVQFFWKLD